jgi:hypothetical protein
MILEVRMAANKAGMTTREEFEKWAEKREFDISPNTTVFADELPYADIETQSHFDAWLASRTKALEEAAAEIQRMKDNPPPNLTESPVAFVLRCCRDAILALRGEGGGKS